MLMEIFGGLAPEGVKLFKLYAQRAKAGSTVTVTVLYVRNRRTTQANSGTGTEVK